MNEDNIFEERDILLDNRESRNTEKLRYGKIRKQLGTDTRDIEKKVRDDLKKVKDIYLEPRTQYSWDSEKAINAITKRWRKERKILITGGAGFIGSHLAKLYIKYGSSVTLLDNFVTGKFENIANTNVEIIEGDILDLSKIKQAVNNKDYIFHLAAIPSVQYSIKHPIETIKLNTLGTLKLLEMSKKAKVKKFIYMSSAGVYGDLNKPATEESKLNPLSPYALSKMQSEELCNLYSRLYNLNTVSVRCFNVYGPRQSIESEYAAVIPTFEDRIKNNLQPVIYGDGNQLRDFIHVYDVVNALIILAEKGEGVYNVGSGNGISINDIADIMLERHSSDLVPKYEKARVGDIRYSIADISKIETLGWKPRHSVSELK